MRDTEIDRVIREAAKALKILSMQYRSKDLDMDEEATTYLVEPYSYRNKGKTFFAFDTKEKSIKAFKVANIVSVTKTEETYKPRWPVELQ